MLSTRLARDWLPRSSFADEYFRVYSVGFSAVALALKVGLVAGLGAWGLGPGQERHGSSLCMQILGRTCTRCLPCLAICLQALQFHCALRTAALAVAASHSPIFPACTATPPASLPAGHCRLHAGG